MTSSALLVLTMCFTRSASNCLKEYCAPGSLPGVAVMIQPMLRSVWHCLKRYDLGNPSTTIDNLCMNSSPTPNLSIRYNMLSTFALSSSLSLEYCVSIDMKFGLKSRLFVS